MNIKNIKIKMCIIIFAVLYIFLTAFSFYIYFKSNPNFVDFNGNRICCGYILSGINPLKHIGENLISNLGTVPVGFGNLPYGLLLGNLFYFGFLDLELARICFIIMTCIVYVLLFVYSYSFFNINLNSNNKLLFIFFTLFSILSINIIASIRCGNIGHIICMLILLSIFTLDTHPILSSIFLSLAMIKPQIAFPFCLTMLILKKIKVLSIAAFIDIIASLFAAFMTHENVLSMFIDFFNAKVGSNWTSYGILTFLYKSDYYKALIPSMILGIALLIIFTILLKDKKNIFIMYSIPSIICSIWSYSWSSDHYILIIPTMAFLFLIISTDIKIHNIVLSEIFMMLYLFIVSIISVLKRNGTATSIVSNVFGVGGSIGVIIFVDFILILSLAYLIHISNTNYEKK